MDAGETSKRQSTARPPISPLDAEAKVHMQHRRALDGSSQGSSMDPPNSSTGPHGQSSNVLSSPNDRLTQTNSISTSAISAQTIAAGSALASLSGILSPSDTQRHSSNDAEMLHQSKQSLPSIHEALRTNLPPSYPESTRPSRPTALYPSSLPETKVRQNNPEHYPSTRSYYEDSASHPVSSPRLNGSVQTFAPPALPLPPPPPISRPHPDGSARPYSPSLQNGKPSTLNACSTDQSPIPAAPPPLPPPPPPQSISYPPTTRPQPSFDPSGIPRCSPQTLHGQHSYPPRCQFGNLTPASPSTAALAFPPHPAPPVINQGFPPQNGPTASGLGQPRWVSDQRDENKVQEIKRNGRIPEPAYGESVKRHLELFDLEASLNEIAEGSGRMLDFTKLYGRLAYQSPRTYALPTPMPTIAEIDDLISREGRMHESLNRIREMILEQQTALAEQAQEPRIKGLIGSAAEEDTKSYASNVNSGDPKRRKGRAAPPGRCHSCNRAETPEWRRGPDGARTLCNACGLHYAKLTRKMGQSSEVTNSGSSLRPKTVGRAGSPVR